MGKSRKACIAGVCILLAVVAVASFFIGYKVAVDKNKTSWTKEETETFYATITQINDKNFTVKLFATVSFFSANKDYTEKDAFL